MEEFKALWAENIDAKVETTIRTFKKEDLPDGEVLIEVHYSSVNYKDGLAGTNPKSGVIRNYPIILGIDLSGVVVESLDPTFQAGDKVIVTGYGLGVSHFGGFSQYARVPAAWVVPLPEGLSLKEAMIIGTAGYTAAESVDALEKQGIQPQTGSCFGDRGFRRCRRDGDRYAEASRVYGRSCVPQKSGLHGLPEGTGC